MKILLLVVVLIWATGLALLASQLDVNAQSAPTFS